MSTESGFSNQKMFGRSRHKTLQPMGSDRMGVPTAQMYLYELTPSAIAITDIQISKDSKSLRLSFDGPHLASVGDIVRFTSGNLKGWEVEVVGATGPSILDILNIGSVNKIDVLPAIADAAKTLAWTTATSDSTGALQVAQVSETPVSLRSYANIDFTVDNVDDSAFVELIPSVGATPIKKVQIFMSSGEPLEIAFGGALVEVVQGYIIPGGNGFVEMAIPASTRVSVRAAFAGTTVSEGKLLVNFLG